MSEVSFINNFTNLRNLDLHTVTRATDCWLRIYRLLDHIRSPSFRTLVVHYEASAIHNPALIIETQLLAPVDTLIDAKFARLEQVRIIARYLAEVDSQERRDALRAHFHASMACLHAAGKLEVHFEPYSDS